MESRGRLDAHQLAEYQAPLSCAKLADLADLADCDMVVEAIVARLDAKVALFRSFDVNGCQQARKSGGNGCWAQS